MHVSMHWWIDYCSEFSIWSPGRPHARVCSLRPGPPRPPSPPKRWKFWKCSLRPSPAWAALASPCDRLWFLREAATTIGIRPTVFRRICKCASRWPLLACGVGSADFERFWGLFCFRKASWIHWSPRTEGGPALRQGDLSFLRTWYSEKFILKRCSIDWTTIRINK